ncbi:MAG TPA: hypothetical protein VM677_05460 [Actinokineospora sp.]|nr:hypothetical protein [Actinokineospora sp.]
MQEGSEIAARYRVRGTPGAVLIDADGRIAARVAGGPLAIREPFMDLPNAKPLTPQASGVV